MTKRKIAPVKPGDYVELTLYIADLNRAISIYGSSHKHYWHKNNLNLIVMPLKMKQSNYTGNQNVVVFHTAERKHYMSRLHMSEHEIDIQFYGIEQAVLFEEPICAWTVFEFENFPEIATLPPPKIQKIFCSFDSPSSVSKTSVMYHSSLTPLTPNCLNSSDNLNKLDIIIDEIDNE